MNVFSGYGPRKPVGPVVAMVLSLVAVGAMVLLRRLLDPYLGNAYPLVTLFGAVAFAAWVGGFRAAVVAAIAGYLACDYLFVAPRNVIGFWRSTETLVGFLAYAITCTVIILLGEAMRRARAQADDGQERLRVTLRSIGDGVITTDSAARITDLNDIAAALTGWSTAEARGRALDEVFNIVNETTRERVESPVARSIRDGVVVGLANHTLLLRRDGSTCPIDDSAAPIRDATGAITGCVLIFRDVTVQRTVEHERSARLASARLLAAIIESSDDAIISKNLDGVIQSWNAAAGRLFGWSADEAIGKHISLLIPPERLHEEEMIISHLRRGQRIEQMETVRVHKDRRLLDVVVTVSPVRDERGEISGASKLVRDVTERRRIETDRNRLVTLVENSGDFIAIYDLDGVPFFVNRAGLRMIGLDSIDDARTKTVADFFFAEDRARIVDEFFPSVLAHGRGAIEIRFRHMATGEPIWMAYKVMTLAGADGKPDAFATVSQDISQRKRMETNLRALASELSIADRRKNEFIATLSHELRGPLAPLSNMLAVMKRADDRATVERARDTMERQLAQLVRLVDDLLDVNRITSDRLELRQSDVELSAILNQAMEAVRPLIELEQQTLAVELSPEPLWLRCDPARLAQVFGNLLHNSSKYTPPGGHIRLTTARDGSDAVITVADDGMGIPASELELIFDMFTQLDHTQQRAQRGLGIGLALVKRLVTLHHGSVFARSAGPGQGSEFVVRLPALDAHAIAAAPLPMPAPPPRRVLVADDNPDSAESLAMLLQLEGHHVVVANDGVAALDLAEQSRPEVMLLDIGMPGLSGHEVCRAVRERPWGRAVRIIALTGWGQEEDQRRSVEAGFDGHLVKPAEYELLMRLMS